MVYLVRFLDNQNIENDPKLELIVEIIALFDPAPTARKSDGGVENLAFRAQPEFAHLPYAAGSFRSAVSSSRIAGFSPQIDHLFERFCLQKRSSENDPKIDYARAPNDLQ